MADDLTFVEMMEFVDDRVDEETADFNGELPNHAASLLVSTADDLLQTVTNVRILKADEDVDDPSDDEVVEALSEDAVDLLLALGSLRAEYDLDIAEAFSDRMRFVENYQNFEEDVDDSSTPDEVMAAFEEHMDEDAEELLAQMGGVEAGMNVDDDGYEHEETSRSFA